MLPASSLKILKAFTYNFLVPNYIANRNIAKTVSVENKNSNLQVCFFHLTFLLLGVGLNDIHLFFLNLTLLVFFLCAYVDMYQHVCLYI